MKTPAAWTSVTLGDVATLKHGYAFASTGFGADGEHCLLTPGNFHPSGGIRDLGRAQKHFSGTFPEQFLLGAGDLLVAMTEQAPGLLGAALIVPDDRRSYLHNQRLGLVQIAEPAWVGAEYLFHWLALPTVRQTIAQHASGTKVKHTSPGRLESLPIMLPPLPEQWKITEILRTWDDAIERSETLVRAETEAFGALRRRLFVSGGHEVPLSEVSRRITTKSDGAPHTVMAISAKTGFVAQAEKYRRDMAGASVANYTLLRRGEFAYNKGNSLTYPQGCIYALNTDSALVPNVYYSFGLRPDLNSGYYEQFFASGALNRQLAQRITSGVRGNGLLNLNADEFFGVMVPVPDRATQDAAADALNAGARRIELLQRKAELLRTQKRGLMQKLLTGQLRVNVAAENEPAGEENE